MGLVILQIAPGVAVFVEAQHATLLILSVIGAEAQQHLDLFTLTANGVQRVVHKGVFHGSEPSSAVRDGQSSPWFVAVVSAPAVNQVATKDNGISSSLPRVCVIG